MKPRTTGEFLARQYEVLDQIADIHGLRRLSSFTDPREVPEDWDRPPWELEEALGPSVEWFPASEGQGTFSELARLIRDEPEIAQTLDSPELIVDELEDLARILEVAARVKGKFRLEMG
jgi:DNA-binding PucR family transcriptional regulator